METEDLRARALDGDDGDDNYDDEDQD